jgi:hypothetical protein
MARSTGGIFGESGGMGRGIGPSYTFKSTKSGVKTKGSISKSKKKDSESFTFKSSELTPAERKAVKQQNKNAKSMTSKDLDAMERGQRGAETRKRNQKKRDAMNQVKGAAKLGAGLATVVAGKKALEKTNKKSNKKKK